MNKEYWQASIVDVQEFGINTKDKDILFDAFEYVMQRTPSLTKKAEFEIDEFASTSKYVKGYTLKIERLLREPKLEQWKATFIKNDKIMMIAMGQLDR